MSRVWYIKDLWLFICCQMERQGEKKQTHPAVQHHATKGKSTFIDDPPNEGTLRGPQFTDIPKESTHKKAVDLGLGVGADVFEENIKKEEEIDGELITSIISTHLKHKYDA